LLFSASTVRLTVDFPESATNLDPDRLTAVLPTGYAMTLTTFGIVFVVGATLGLCFKVPILLPAIGLAAVGTAGVGSAHGGGIGTVMLTIAFVAAVLQIGYLFGLVIRAVIASLGVHARKPVAIEKVGLRRR
jgi:hypothetical protein